MGRPHLLPGLAGASFALAGLALASLLWVAPTPDAATPEGAHASAERAVLVSRFLAGALAAGGIGALWAFARRARSEAARPLALLAGLGVLAAVLAASVAADDRVTGAVHAAYTEGGTLTRAEGMDLARPPGLDEKSPAFVGERRFPDAAAPIELGPVPARAGDTWSVGVSVKGPAWEGDAQPALVVDPPARCAVAHVQDYRHEAWPGVSVLWRCVVLASGDARIRAVLPEATEGAAGIHVAIVPSLDLLMAASLTDSLTVLAAALALAALGARAVARRRDLAGYSARE